MKTDDGITFNLTCDKDKRHIIFDVSVPQKKYFALAFNESFNKTDFFYFDTNKDAKDPLIEDNYTYDN